MYAGKCKHGKIIAGTVGFDIEGKSMASISSEYIEFAVFIKDLLDRGYTVSKQDSITLQKCYLCERENIP